MKRFQSIVLAIIALVCVSCGNNNATKVEKEFWETNMDFEAPADWETYSYADAFSIQIPNYMKEKEYETFIDPQKVQKGDSNFMSLQENTLGDKPLGIGESADMSFTARNDSAHNSYARIHIQYMKSVMGDFNDSYDLIDMNRADTKEFCDILIKNQLGNGRLIKVRNQEMIFTNKANVALDVCYQREGNTDNEGPVTVHIYYLQHTDEAILLTVSYHDKNKDLYKDLFNIVETIDWTHHKSRNYSSNY